MGAVYLQSGVCLLPKTEDHLRQLKMLENEIAEAGGESVLLESVALERSQQDKVLGHFNADRNELYRELIGRCGDFEAEIARETAANHFTYAELEENDEDLKKLKNWYQSIKSLDFYGAPLRKDAEQHIAKCATLLDKYAHRVFEVHNDRLPSPSAEKSPAKGRQKPVRAKAAPKRTRPGRTPHSP